METLFAYLLSQYIACYSIGIFLRGRKPCEENSIAKWLYVVIRAVCFPTFLLAKAADKWLGRKPFPPFEEVEYRLR